MWDFDTRCGFLSSDDELCDRMRTLQLAEKVTDILDLDAVDAQNFVTNLKKLAIEIYEEIIIRDLEKSVSDCSSLNTCYDKFVICSRSKRLTLVDLNPDGNVVGHCNFDAVVKIFSKSNGYESSA